MFTIGALLLYLPVKLKRVYNWAGGPDFQKLKMREFLHTMKHFDACIPCCVNAINEQIHSKGYPSCECYLDTIVLAGA